MSDHAPAPAVRPSGAPARNAFLITMLLTSGGAAAALLSAPGEARLVVAWIVATSAALVCTCVPLAVHGKAAARCHQQRAEAVERHYRVQVRAAADNAAQQHRTQADAVRAEYDEVVAKAVPDLARRLRGGASAETVRGKADLTGYPHHGELLEAVVTELGTSERGRAARLATCATAAGRVQALATGMLADLRDMQRRHGESDEVLGDLFELDHRTSQISRVADTAAVLSGARTGRSWPRPVAMEGILRGAVGRIDAYRRVVLHSACDIAITSHAAEGVMRALAELMDNATRFSPPDEAAHVYAEENHRGVVITVEDGGPGMPRRARERALRAVGPEPLDLTETSAGTRLGLAVVGCVARELGLTVSFRPSSRGGTGVVVLVPRALLAEPPSREVPAERPRSGEPDELPRRLRDEPATDPAPDGGAEQPAPARFDAFLDALVRPSTERG
ncbi:sensor histidine kinase [Saccharopolyspora cebuensis]|uniref:histidine kinase n=1 Tax=Saccharopolyspora cebuensis TaxID=418759 RepID=A0ABV4CD62_9PSEU